MAKLKKEKSLFLQILGENPLINYACKKTGIARATIYRWIKDNLEFKIAVESALEQGRSHWGEIGESALLKKMKEGDMRAIMYYLRHNNPRYIPLRSVFVEPLSAEERRKYEQSLLNDKSLSPEQVEPILRALRNYGIIGKSPKPNNREL